MLTEVFLDSAYAIALAAETDQLHEHAAALAEELEAGRTRMITTRAVLLEIGNRLSKLRFRNSAVQILSSLNADPLVQIVELSKELYSKGLDLFQSRSDKDWGLIDCISFVMNERGIHDALSSDVHFEQAGFTALLRIR